MDQRLSQADVLDRVRPVAEDLPEGTEEETQEDIELEETEAAPQLLTPAENNDNWSLKVGNWFRHLQYRADAFGANYPFKVSPSGDLVEVEDKLTSGQKLYVFLLLCANLRYCSKAESTLTRSFERLSSEALRTWFSDAAEVHVFGTSEQTGPFKGSLKNKIDQLAKSLGELPKMDKRTLAPTNSGDGGLDIVAWVPLGDSNTHRLVVFGQCACTDEWKTKQHSSSAHAWRQRINLAVDSNNVVFIPHCLRRQDGSWYDQEPIVCIMIDRLRYVHLMKDKLSQFEQETAHAVVVEALKQREGVFN